MSRAIIVCGGDFSPALLPERRETDLVIAADSGYSALQSAGWEPDLTIGDFDSLGFVPEGAQVLPVRKDDTDLMAACREALSRGCREFLLFGTLGGARFSHSVAALQTLGFLAEHGVQAAIVDSRCTVRVLRDAARHYGPEMRGHLSVLALTEATVTLTGLNYNLPPTRLTPAFPLGVSNAFVGREAEIAVSGGTVLIIEEAE